MQVELELVDVAREKAGGHNSYRLASFLKQSYPYRVRVTQWVLNLLLFFVYSCSRSVGGRLVATNVSSPKKLLAVLLLAGTGLALWLQLHKAAQVTSLTFLTGNFSLGAAASASASAESSTQTEECSLLTESVSALCVWACEAVQVRAQASAASNEELVTIGVPGALEALLATRDGLTR